MSFTNSAPEMMNLSFSGCGFLCVYHAGVAAAIKQYAPELARNKISGASAGSIIAAGLICNVCISQATSTVLQVVTQARSRVIGPFHPEFDLMAIVRQELDKVLPPDAHKLCTDKLYISLTRWNDMANVVVSKYDSRQELIDAIICSCYIPLYCGFVPPSYKGTQYIDGGVTDNQPTLDEHSIMVSPFSGESDICPPDFDSASFLGVDFHRTSIRLTTRNLFRITACLMPPSLDDCSKMCMQGFEDAVRFLTRNGMAPCIRCVAIQKTEDESEMESAYASPSDQRAYSPSMRSRTRSTSNLQNIPNRRQRVESECDTCCESEHMYNTRIAEFFPQAVKRKFEEAAHVDSSLFNYVMSFRLVKMTRTALGLTKLPLDMMLLVAKSLSSWMSQVVIPEWLRNRLMRVVNFIYDEFENTRSEYSARFACQLSLTEEMNHRGRRNRLLEKIELSEEAKREKALLRSRDKGNKKITKLRENPPIRIEREWSQVLPSDDLDSTEHVVQFMRSHDAMYEFHFKDEQNKVHTFGLFNVQNADRKGTHSCHSSSSSLRASSDRLTPSPIAARRSARPVSMVVEEDEDAHHKRETEKESEERAVKHTRDACCSPVREVDFLERHAGGSSTRGTPSSHRETAAGKKTTARSTLAAPFHTRRSHPAHVQRKAPPRDASKSVKSSDSEDELGEQFFVPKARERTGSMEYDGEPEQSDTDQASGIDR